MSPATALVALCAAALGLAGCAVPADGTLTLNPPAIQTTAAIPTLMGATPAALTASFGQPALRRVDGTAQVWLYHSPTCGLNLILYPDQAGTPRVADAVPNNNNANACILSLQHGITAAALERPPAS